MKEAKYHHVLWDLLGHGQSGVDSALRKHFHQCTQVMHFLVATSHFAIFTSRIISDLCVGTERNGGVLYYIYNLEFE